MDKLDSTWKTFYDAVVADNLDVVDEICSRETGKLTKVIGDFFEKELQGYRSFHFNLESDLGRIINETWMRVLAIPKKMKEFKELQGNFSQFLRGVAINVGFENYPTPGEFLFAATHGKIEFTNESFKLHYKNLLNYIENQFHGNVDKFEIANEACTQMFVRAKDNNLRIKSSFFQYLKGIARFQALKFLREENKRKSSELLMADLSITDESSQDIELLDTSPPPYEFIKDFEDKNLTYIVDEELKAAFEYVKLNYKDHWNVLILYHVLGLSYQEISILLGIEIGYARLKVYRARAEIIEYYQILKERRHG